MLRFQTGIGELRTDRSRTLGRGKRNSGRKIADSGDPVRVRAVATGTVRTNRENTNAAVSLIRAGVAVSCPATSCPATSGPATSGPANSDSREPESCFLFPAKAKRLREGRFSPVNEDAVGIRQHGAGSEEGSSVPAVRLLSSDRTATGDSVPIRAVVGSSSSCGSESGAQTKRPDQRAPVSSSRRSSSRLRVRRERSSNCFSSSR